MNDMIGTVAALHGHARMWRHDEVDQTGWDWILACSCGWEGEWRFQSQEHDAREWTDHALLSIAVNQLKVTGVLVAP